MNVAVAGRYLLRYGKYLAPHLLRAVPSLIETVQQSLSEEEKTFSGTIKPDRSVIMKNGTEVYPPVSSPKALVGQTVTDSEGNVVGEIVLIHREQDGKLKFEAKEVDHG